MDEIIEECRRSVRTIDSAGELGKMLKCYRFLYIFFFVGSNFVCLSLNGTSVHFVIIPLGWNCNSLVSCWTNGCLFRKCKELDR